MTTPDQIEPPADEGLQPLEEAFYALVLASITFWLGQVALGVLKAPIPDPTALWATVPQWNVRVEQLVSWLRTNQRLRRHGGPLEPSVLDQQLGATRNLLNNIPAQLYTRIMKTISDGHSGNRGRQEIIDDVRALLAFTHWDAEARRIAVTEVNGAANAAWMAAAVREQAQTSQTLYKKWRSSHDHNVRSSHREANGQIRPIGQPFVVGGWPMMQPGDKAGPPDEVIGCRCDLERSSGA